MSAPVFICAAAAHAAVGDTLDLDGDEARHAVTVQRRQPGETIDLVDGHGARATGEIIAVGERRLSIRVDATSRDADAPATLVQALAKGGRDDQAVEAATELGITGIIPWGAARSIVKWQGSKVEKGRAQWESLARAAAKQSRRALIPQVDSLHTTRQLAVAVREAADGGARVLILHEEAAAPLSAIEVDAQTPVWVIVGPEGGISQEELDLLTEAGGRAVVLGAHVLRASSAGPAALAALAVLRGAW